MPQDHFVLPHLLDRFLALFHLKTRLHMTHVEVVTETLQQPVCVLEQSGRIQEQYSCKPMSYPGYIKQQTQVLLG